MFQCHSYWMPWTEPLIGKNLVRIPFRGTGKPLKTIADHSCSRCSVSLLMPSIQTPVEITTPPKKYPLIGHCIYCGTYTKNLSKEHIVPFGLAADSLVLPKASCPTCRDITRKHETTVLRSMWWGMRTRIGAPSRHDAAKDFNLHKGVVEEMSLPWIHKAKIGTVKIEPQQFPLSIVAPKYPAPALLVGRDPTAAVDWGVWAGIDDDEVMKHIPKDKDMIGLAPLEPETFGRFIAKVPAADAHDPDAERAPVALSRPANRGSHEA